jgi:hypothetical protein
MTSAQQAWQKLKAPAVARILELEDAAARSSNIRGLWSNYESMRDRLRDSADPIEVPRIERTRTGAWLVKGGGPTRRYSKFLHAAREQAERR